MRASRAAVMAIAAVILGGFATSASAHAREDLRPVRLVPFQAAANIIPPHFAGLKVHAYDALTNRPLAGREIYFSNSGNTEICRAVTDTHGEASCTGPLQMSPTTLDTIVNGYWATFPGDPCYDSARVHGTVNYIVDPSL